MRKEQFFRNNWMAAATLLLFLLAGCWFLATKYSNKNDKHRLGVTMEEGEEEENDEYDNPERAAEFEFNRMKDPRTGKLSSEKLWNAVLETESLKQQMPQSPMTNSLLTWVERGSNADIVGPSNGNTRPGNGVTSGRIRAVWVDLADPTNKTVWVGGVDGGLWKTTDITAAPATWTPINDYLSNLAISGITQDPSNPNTMYFCTGESWIAGDGAGGIGVFKSTDHGVTWNLLPATTAFKSCTKILCDASGNVYCGTLGISVALGLQRSTDGGTTWTSINPSAVTSRIPDFEISSTGTFYVVAGYGSTASTYFFTTNPAAPAPVWQTATTPYTPPTANGRVELTTNGNTVYAAISSNNIITSIAKSTDGGLNFVTTTLTPGNQSDLGSQATYDLGLGVDPSDANNVMVGGLRTLKSTDGGLTFTKISEWVGTTGQYVHADIHTITWFDNGNKILISSDGGMFYSTNKGVTFTDRNVGLRLKQFYGVSIHPTSTNYFLAGAQDNGTHQFNSPGLGSSVEVTGGDGGITGIDQDEPLFQIATYVGASFRRSQDGGANWFTNANNTNVGQFIDPLAYDNAGNKVYAGGNANQILRWENPHSGFSITTVPLTTLSGGSVASVAVSPYTANRVYVGTTNGRVVILDNADAAAPAETNITPAGMTGYVNAVVEGSSDQNIIAIASNTGINNVYSTTNGGTSWTACDGNLPDMPVYWAFFYPEDNTKAYIATETGIWSTDFLNGPSTNWIPETTFPTVKTMMLQYRPSDRTLAAATHGRGLWTTTVALPSGFDLGNPAAATVACPAPATMSIVLPTISNGGFTNTITFSATGAPSGTSVSFSPTSVTPGASTTVTLNNTNTLSAGSYVIAVTGTATGSPNVTRNLTFTITAGVGPTITLQPTSQALCEGGSVTFTVAASAGTYQWQVSTPAVPAFTNITGQTAASLTINPVTASMTTNQYRCVVSTLCGITNSAAAVLTVNTAPAITAQPQTATLCAGSNNTFSVTATGTAVTYQWQISTAAVPAFTNIPGATNSTFTVNGITAAMNGDQYKCVVSGTCSPAATSTAATLNVITSVAVTTQPVNTTACDASPASFTVAGSGSGVIYQWQVNTGTGFVNIPAGAPYSGINSATLTISAVTNAMNNYQYRALLSNASCTTPGISNTATLSVNSLPSISANPQDATICLAGSNTFSVTASGTGISYQWQMNTTTAPAFVNIPGATSPTYTVANATAIMTGNQYRVVVTGTCSASTATSSAATLTVIIPVAITTQPGNAEICSGTNATFSVVASSPQQTILYQWDVSTDGGTNWTAIPGATASSYTVTSAIVVMTNNKYRVRVSNATCSVPTVSGSAILTVRQLPTVGLTASATSLSPGKSSTLTATPSLPTGGTLSTTWTFNGAPLSVTGNTYIANVEKVGAYQVRIQETWPSSLFCSNLSQVVTIDAPASSKLFIFPSPNDGRFTVSYYNNGGTSTSRSVTVYDSRGARVEFKKFTVTGPYTLLAIDVRPAQKGVYYVVVGDAAGKQLADGKVIIQ